jgi:Protein of unknown function (DUF3168)
MLSEGLYALLSQAPEVVQYLGTKASRRDNTNGVFSLTMPTNTPMPALVISQIAGSGDTVMEGASGFRTARLQITAHGTTFPETKKLARAARRLLDSASLVLPDDEATRVYCCELVVEVDFFDVAPFECRTVLDLQLSYCEP